MSGEAGFQLLLQLLQLGLLPPGRLVLQLLLEVAQLLLGREEGVGTLRPVLAPAAPIGEKGGGRPGSGEGRPRGGPVGTSSTCYLPASTPACILLRVLVAQPQQAWDADMAALLLSLAMSGKRSHGWTGSPKELVLQGPTSPRS